MRRRLMGTLHSHSDWSGKKVKYLNRLEQVPQLSKEELDK